MSSGFNNEAYCAQSWVGVFFSISVLFQSLKEVNLFLISPRIWCAQTINVKDSYSDQVLFVCLVCFVGGWVVEYPQLGQ
jgi:hypothetical protein